MRNLIFTIFVTVLVAGGKGIADSGEAENERPISETSPDHYVAPDGDDGGDGSRSDPWREIQKAIGRLESGEVLALRGGTYRQFVKITGGNTPDGPITIRAEKGEVPVISGYISEFTDLTENAWIPVDRDRLIWRSAQHYSGRLSGKIQTRNGYYALVAYGKRGGSPGYQFLRSDTEAVRKDGIRYLGPGISYPEGRSRDEEGPIYLRMQPPSKKAVHRAFHVPRVKNPNRRKLLISNRRWGIFFDGAENVTMEGITVAGHERSLRVGDSRGIVFRNMRLMAGQIGVIVRSGVKDVLIDRCTLDLNLPPWIAWTDLKGGKTPAHPSLKQAGVVFAGSAEHVRIRDSRFNGVFDGVTAVRAVKELRIIHNEFDVRDDALQLGSASASVEFGYNLCHGPGPSHHGMGKHGGQKWIHHNVVDVSEEFLWGRADPDGILQSKYRGWRPHVPLPSHGSGAADPWKIYNSTFIFGDHIANSGAGLDRFGARNRETGIHEVFNNISIQLADDFVLRGPVVGDGLERYDGNLYFRAVDGDAPFFLQVGRVNGGNRNFDTFQAFMESGMRQKTEETYAPGWEASGVSANPRLDGQYRPAPGSPAATGAVDLSGKGWPGATDDPFRGALPPAGGLVGPRPE